jgi:Mitochondrial carrier protein
VFVKSPLKCRVLILCVCCDASDVVYATQRLQVQQSNPDIFNYKGPVDALVKIVKAEGVPALFDGLGARVLWLTPRLSITVSVYDLTKRYFAKPSTST